MTQQLEAAVDKMRNEIVRFLQRLIQIPSENPPGNYLDICDYLDRELTRLGFEVKVIDVPVETTGCEGITYPRKNVIATMKGQGNGRRLIFNSHIDTVPAGDPNLWTYPPYSGTIADGKMYGRGATDSKGRLAAYIMSAVALKRAGVSFDGDIIIAATCDEETGGVLGAGYVTGNRLVEGDVVVVEGYSNHIIRAMAGVMQLRIISKGIPAHAGFKWKGINAIEKMAKVVQGLFDLQKELEQELSSIPGMKYTTVNVGVIQGGTKENVVPGSCEIAVDFRIIPEQNLEKIYSRVKMLMNRLAEEDPEMDITIERLSGFETEPTLVAEDSPLIAELQKSVKAVTGKELPVVGMLGQTDLRWFIQNGIPGINFGPGTNANNLHGYDEFIEIEDLIQTTKILTVFAKNMVANGKHY